MRRLLPHLAARGGIACLLVAGAILVPGVRPARAAVCTYVVADPVWQGHMTVVGQTLRTEFDTGKASVISAMTAAHFKPHAESLDYSMYISGCAIISASMFIALLLKVNVSQEDQYSQRVFSGVLIAMQVGMVGAVLSHFFAMGHQGWRERNKSFFNTSSGGNKAAAVDAVESRPESGTPDAAADMISTSECAEDAESLHGDSWRRAQFGGQRARMA